jgi:hypothetical protein
MIALRAGRVGAVCAFSTRAYDAPLVRAMKTTFVRLCRLPYDIGKIPETAEEI